MTFLPMIDVVFEVTDASQSYHVPIVVSPYGYSRIEVIKPLNIAGDPQGYLFRDIA